MKWLKNNPYGAFTTQRCINIIVTAWSKQPTVSTEGNLLRPVAIFHGILTPLMVKCERGPSKPL